MISPDKLERYKDFIDPDYSGVPYDPRKGIDRLLGVLSPDPKGIVLAAMGSDWYSGRTSLTLPISHWLEDLGLDKNIWPIQIPSAWRYCETNNDAGEVVDGSLVSLGAVVKKIENPSQRLYSRSTAGAELALPLVQQAVLFVSKAIEYAEARSLEGKKPPKFDSMWRIIGPVNSTTDQRRPLAVYDTIDFLIHNPGRYRPVDLQDSTHLSQGTLDSVLSSLGNCGVIDYETPKIEREGKSAINWSVYEVDSRELLDTIDASEMKKNIKKIYPYFRQYGVLIKVLNHIREFPDSGYEYKQLADKLGIAKNYISFVLSALAKLGILKRPNLDLRGASQASASANDLTHILYDLVCAPTNEVTATLTPLPLRIWDKEKVAVYLQNYNDERSQNGLKGGQEARDLITDILQQDTEMKLSHIIDSFNSRLERELKNGAIYHHLKILIESGILKQTRPGYYRLIQK